MVGQKFADVLPNYRPQKMLLFTVTAVRTSDTTEDRNLLEPETYRVMTCDLLVSLRTPQGSRPTGMSLRCYSAGMNRE